MPKILDSPNSPEYVSLSPKVVGPRSPSPRKSFRASSRRHMRHTLAAVLCIVIPITVFSADNGYKVTYDGGSLPDTKSGTGVKIFIEQTQVRFARDKADIVTIPASAI